MPYAPPLCVLYKAGVSFSMNSSQSCYRGENRKMQGGWRSNWSECLDCSQRRLAHHCNSCTDLASTGESNVIKGSVVVRIGMGQPGPGKAASIQLYSRTEIDRNTGNGRLSENAHLKDGKKSKHNGAKIRTYRVKFHLEPEFGIPGAFIIKNCHKHEFFLMSVTLELATSNDNLHFECNSWVYPMSKTITARLFFSNSSYHPNQTPEALRLLREEELQSLRGDGQGERMEWDRIYDYDVYNDLASPDPGGNHVRPILGGTKTFPYPRRGRTGRPRSKGDPQRESRPNIISLDTYVPADERFSPAKFNEFISHSIQAIVHFLIPEAKSLFQDESGFQSFSQIYEMYAGPRSHTLEGWLTDRLRKMVPEHVVGEFVRSSKKNPVKFPEPQIIAENEMAWKDDEEFGREMLAGVNPGVIECLEAFPLKGKSSIEAYHLEANLDGLTVGTAVDQRRLFILDHHDQFMPFINRINTQEVRVYASRTILFSQTDLTLKPVAIELSLPSPDGEDEEISRVFLPAAEGMKRALWQLAKAHVAVNDSGHHQLISHWLKTHAVVEPFIIATRRQLSVMHPVYKLLDPHFKDTMHINALARSILINSGGILEKTMFPGKFSMELSSAFYKDWRFDEQALPVDLLKRGMAVEAPDHPSGVLLRLRDYPYGEDGLEIWSAIKTWVTDYCSFYYPTDTLVVSDSEIQSWWSEIRHVGHGDKSGEKWWCPMQTVSDLVQTLTTLIWIASAMHASVNFGQYGYAGFPPNRPTICRRFIPEEGTEEFVELLRDPDKYYLKMLPKRFTASLGVALIEILSTHMSDEVYLGRRASSNWTDNEEIRRRFDKFTKSLKEVEKRIVERNRDPRLKNRLGPARVPYTLLYPDTTNAGSTGVTGMGIPNSVSI